MMTRDRRDDPGDHTGGLFAQLTARRVLRDAWQDVLTGDQEDGTLGGAVARFAADAEENLNALAASLRDGTYRPWPLTPVEIPRPDAAPRLLHVPAARDRVVERALLKVLTPVVDPVLGSASFAYRPGLGVADAVQAVARLRDEGLTWVVRTDLHDCFPSVDVGRVRRMLGALIDDERVLAVVDALLARPAGSRVMRGLAQGAPLSPMLTNLALTPLDERILDAGFPVIRFADDLVVFASDRDEAWEALRVTNAAAEEIGMSLGSDKTDVMSFEEGFSFLGEDFGPRYPPTTDGHRVIDPVRRVLYVARQGARVRIDGGRLRVESAADEELLDVPSGSVERVVLFGSVGLSAGARSWALGHNVDCVFLSRRGTYLGTAISGRSATRVARLRRQLAATGDTDFCLRIGRALVEAKLRKQAVLLRRLVRRRSADAFAEALPQIEAMVAMTPECGDRTELMGVEGAAARAYFSALGGCVPDELAFAGRSRRPPGDVVNAALSYGYAILLSEAVAATVAAGLDPAIGFLHADHEVRPSLALDLMEEFRPLVVDQVVLAAALRSELRAEHGRRDEQRGGVLLTRAGREVIVNAYERRMLQMTRGALPGFSGCLRRHLYRQAARLAACVHDPEQTWTGLSLRSTASGSTSPQK